VYSFSFLNYDYSINPINKNKKLNIVFITIRYKNKTYTIDDNKIKNALILLLFLLLYLVYFLSKTIQEEYIYDEYVTETFLDDEAINDVELD
jgi:hypothetical protein